MGRVSVETVPLWGLMGAKRKEKVMGLSVRPEEGTETGFLGGAYPALTCDTCGRPIEDWGMGIVYYRRGAEGQAFVPVNVYHKLTCDPVRHERIE